jgi:hypothetical protein
MSSVKYSLVPGQVPAPSQMQDNDIAINNADGALYIVKVNGSSRQVIPIGGVSSFNNRVGIITLTSNDVSGALGYVPVGSASPAFTGTPTAPTATAGSNSAQIATTAFVANALANFTVPPPQVSLASLTDVSVTEGAGIDGYVLSYSAGQIKWIAKHLATVATSGSYTDLTNTPVLAAVATSGSYADLTNKPAPYTLPVATTSVLGGVKAGTGVTIASDGTLTVSASYTLAGLADVSVTEGPAINNDALTFNSSTSKWQATGLATVAFSGKYSDLINAPVSTVTSFNNRTGTVSLTATDVTNVGGALLASPAFSGIPTAPTATAGTSTTQLATTAFVANAITASGGVTSFNTRTGAVTLTTTDVTNALGYTPATKTSQLTNDSGFITSSALTGYAPLASPGFTGAPTAPTATAGTNTTQLATTAFVTTAVSGVAGGAAVISNTYTINSNTSFSVPAPFVVSWLVIQNHNSTASATVTVGKTNGGSEYYSVGSIPAQSSAIIPAEKMASIIGNVDSATSQSFFVNQSSWSNVLIVTYVTQRLLLASYFGQ